MRKYALWVGLMVAIMATGIFAAGAAKSRTYYMPAATQMIVPVDSTYEPPVGVQSVYVFCTNNVVTNTFTWTLQRRVVATNGVSSITVTNTVLRDSFLGSYIFVPVNRMVFDLGDTWNFSNSIAGSVVVINYEGK